MIRYTIEHLGKPSKYPMFEEGSSPAMSNPFHSTLFVRFTSLTYVLPCQKPTVNSSSLLMHVYPFEHLAELARIAVSSNPYG